MSMNDDSFIDYYPCVGETTNKIEKVLIKLESNNNDN